MGEELLTGMIIPVFTTLDLKIELRAPTVLPELKLVEVTGRLNAGPTRKAYKRNTVPGPERYWGSGG